MKVMKLLCSNFYIIAMLRLSEDEGDKSDSEKEILKEKVAQMKRNILTLT